MRRNGTRTIRSGENRSPVVALRNLRGALKPGARLTMVVWRRKLDNDWTYRGELIVKGYLGYVISSDGQTAAADNAGSAPISSELQSQLQPAIDAIGS